MKKNNLLMVLVFCLLSCKKESSNQIASIQEDVYVAGYVADDASSNLEFPTYWKNGEPVDLNIDYYLETARALSVAVSGNDVYVAGYRINFSPTAITTVGIFWKNGVPEELTNFMDYPRVLTSLALSNNDVYMASLDNLWGGTIARYWKNGNPVSLTDGSASSIAVSGSNVYVAGSGISGNGNGVAKYWKNGSPVNLTDGSIDAKATSVAVSGNDVYVAGDEYGVAKYWKNGSAVKLTDGLTGAEANAIALSGTDIYVAGTQWDGMLSHNANGVEYNKSIAKYWKNANPINLTDGSTDAEAKSIAVSGNDVYVAGFENGVAKYWKNGSPVVLGDVSKYSEAYSIFLAQK